MKNLKPLRTFNKKSKIFFLGDTHGNMSYFFNICKRVDLRDIIIFHVGDFGAGFKHRESLWINEINGKLSERNITMYVIRGNHDDPAYYQGDYLLSNLKLVPDYTTLKIGDRRFLMVGGAVSVDRIHRIISDNNVFYNTGSKLKTWWKDELFNLDTNKLSKYRGITDVITHSAPDFVPPFGPLPSFILANAREDSTLIETINTERANISIMSNILSVNNKIDNWYYGHFHDSSIYNAPNNETNFILLNINELI